MPIDLETLNTLATCVAVSKPRTDFKHEIIGYF